MSALPPLATVGELEVRLGLTPGTLADLDLARAEAALADASELVRAEGGIPWVDLSGEATAPPAVVVVVLQSAKRAYLNPNGYATESVSAGGASYSYSNNQQALTIYLTADELRTVQGAAHLVTYAAGARAWHGTGSVSVRTHERRPLPGGGFYQPWSWSP